MLRNRASLLIAVVFAGLLCDASSASAQIAPSLGSAQSFAVLSGSTVTNTGASTITGDLGVSPGAAVTGFPPGLVVSGTIHAADASRSRPRIRSRRRTTAWPARRAPRI